jgi:hypothetical protein
MGLGRPANRNMPSETFGICLCACISMEEYACTEGGEHTDGKVDEARL